MKTYQLIYAGLLVASLTINLAQDFQPQKAREARGWPGVITTIITGSLVVWLLIKCGTFSAI